MAAPWARAHAAVATEAFDPVVGGGAAGQRPRNALRLVPTTTG